MLRTYRERFPGVRMEIREMTTAPQIVALHEKTIDVGLLREPPADEPELSFNTVLTEGFVAVLPVAHPLAVHRSVTVAQLADCPFVLPPRAVGPQLHDQIAALCRDAGFAPQVAQHAVEWNTVCALVEAGLGISVVPASIRKIRLSGVVFRRIKPRTTTTRVALAWRRNDQSPLLATLLHTIKTDPGWPSSQE